MSVSKSSSAPSRSPDLGWITNFIWGIADDVLRDLYVRGRYRDLILPMTVLRRLDAVLEPTKQAVLDMKESLDSAGVANQDQALRQASGQAFHNTSKFTLRDLKSRTRQQKLRQDFEAYLNGFSPNVQVIIDNFEFRNQIPRLSKADALGTLIERFLDSDINLSPQPVFNGDGSVKHPGLDNHAMGTIFEELLRRFNEENNEEAGEHWTPRDVVKLMARLVFIPIADQIQSGTYLLYDGACGTGGMLTVADETLDQLAAEHGKEVATHLYGQEINAETYAICKADLLLKGEGDEADNIIGGPEYSTLSNDAFPSREFDFMLSNPPYGKSWKGDLERLGGKKGIKDPRFIIDHADDPEFSLTTRSSDGQLLFLVNMLSKMKHDTKLGSRIAEVHNGSSLFTGDAGQGESNIRQWIIENDWLEAVVALPLNMFYNTGIATYIWIITNRKAKPRKGKVQLIDASKWFKPLRKNLGKKNCELSEDDIKRICDVFLGSDEGQESKILSNEEFGYYKVTVERPLRLRSQLSRKLIESLKFASGDVTLRSDLYDRLGESLFDDFASVRTEVEGYLTGDSLESADEDEEATAQRGVSAAVRKRVLNPKSWQRDTRLYSLAGSLQNRIGEEVFIDHNAFVEVIRKELSERGEKLSAADFRTLVRGLSWRDDDAPPVLKRIHKNAETEPDPVRGRHQIELDGKQVIVEFEPDVKLRDTEYVPLVEEQGIEGFFRREVLPHASDAWYVASSIKRGYEISFGRSFYRPPVLRTLDEIGADILETEKQAEGLLEEIVGPAV